MQSYKDLLRDIKDGNSSSFERIFRGWPFDCSGYSYGAPPLFNAVASSICEDSKADDIRIQELLHAQPPGYEQAVEAAKERISGREKILQLLCNHLQVAHLINASDLRSGLTPIQIALEANDTNLINTLFRKGVNPASKLKVGGVEHCTLFMKALDCAEEGRSVELLEGVARGSTSRKLFESEPGEKARHKIKSQFMEYILGLNENYKISLPVLYSSSGACKNIFHSIIEKKDTRALSWLKRLLLSENPIIEEVEKISKELGLPADLADRILKDTKESNAGFVKHRSKTCAADLILNSPAMEYSPLELSLKTLSAPEELPFVMQVPIKKIDGKGYKTVGEALEEVGSEEAHHVLRACVKFATPNLLKDLFLGDKGRARLDVLCELHMDGDGKITDQKCISVLASNAPEKLAGLVRESTVEVGKALPVLAIYGTPQVLQGIEAHITTEALKKENADGLNALEVAITSGNHTFAEWILTKLENDLNSLAGGELISLQNKTDRILAKAHKESGGNLLHLAAQHAPQLLKQILRLSTNSNHLLGSKDSKGLLAAHYQTSEKSLLDGLKPLIEERLERPVQEAELKADVELHAAIANGDKSALEKLFILKSENVYKVIDTVDGGKSILEVAAESKQPDLVRYILQEHKKLQAKSQNECKEIEIQLSAIEGMQQQQGMEAKIRELRMAKEQKSELQQSRGKMLSQQASKTVLGVLSKQAESSWHVDILGMADSLADLSEDEYVASALDASMNPVVTAIQSGNNPVAEKILAASPRFADESLKELLVEKGSGNGLLKYGFGVSALYDRRYSPPEKSESKIQFDVSAAAENVVRSETEKYRSAVSDRFMGKGVLLPYAHAVSKDTNSAENLKDKLNDIKDGDPTLLSVQSADGHNLGTLIAAFGNIAQWKSYANKYKKLKASDKGDPSPIGDMSAKIGSPAQAVLLAKYFAHSDDMRRHKDLMFDHFMIHYPQSTLLQNGEGDNLLHTIVRCEDLDALQAVMEHDSHTIQDLISGLKQRNNGGKSVLELALHLNNAAMLKCIIENSMARGGTDAACSLLLDCRLLHDAVLNGNRVMVKLLAELQRMLNIALSPGGVYMERQLDTKKRDPFALAVEIGNADILKEMVDAGLQMDKKSIEEALIKAPATFEETKLREIVQLLGMSEHGQQALLEKREQHLAQGIAADLSTVKRVEPIGERSLNNYITESTRLAAEDAAVFEKKSRRAGRSVLSNFQLEFDKCGAALENLITTGKGEEALHILRNNRGIVDSLPNRTGVIEAALHSEDMSLVKSIIRSSNKFVKDENGDSLLHLIILHGCNEELVDLCIDTGYSLSDISESTGKSAFELIQEKSPSTAAKLCTRSAADLRNDQAILRFLNLVLDSANAGKNSDDVGSLCSEMNSRKPGYAFPVFSHLFSQISSEREHGSTSLLQKRLDLIKYMCKNVSHLKERSPHTGDNILHMLFSVLTNSPYVVTAVEDVLNSILGNSAFSADLLLEKNKDGVSPMDILAKSKYCTQMLSNILRFVPSVGGKISFPRMLMLSVLQGNSEATSRFLDQYTHLMDVNAVDSDGISSLECAILNRSSQIANVLFKHGADINCLDPQGRNLLDRMLDNAIEKGIAPPKEMITFLIERGIDLTHSSSGISTLGRCRKLESYRDTQRNRFIDLVNKEELSHSEYTELRILQSAQLHLNYCDIFYAAQVERTRLNGNISKQVASTLYKASDTRFFANTAAMPTLIRRHFTLNEEKSSATIVGGMLNVKIHQNASVDINGLLKVAQGSGISRSTLSFNGGRDILEVQKRSDGLINYTPKKGAALISTKVRVDGHDKTIHLRITADGGVSFDPEARQDCHKLNGMLSRDKIDFGDSHVYINGIPLGKAMKSPAAPSTAPLRDAAKALKEAGASTGAGQGQPILPRSRQPETQRRESI